MTSICSSGDGQLKDKAVENLYAVLGAGTVLIPILSGNASAGPSLSKPSLAETQTPAYQDRLAASDIAVLCGKESGNLCAVQFDTIEGYNSFLEANPRLRKTLIIAGAERASVFLRIVDGPLPPSFATASGIWASEGAAVLAYNRAQPTAVSVVSVCPPVAIGLAELIWNPEMNQRFFYFAVAGVHGMPFRKSRRGRWGVNVMFWSKFFYGCNQIVFNGHGRQFLLGGADGWRPVAEEVVSQALLTFFLEWQGPVPPCAITDGDLKSCVKNLRIIAANPDETPPAEDHLEDFVKDTFELSPGRGITSEEFFRYYRDWAQSRRVIRLAERQFLTKLPHLLASAFGVGKNHCTSRNGKDRRGYSGLRLKSQGPDRNSEQQGIQQDA